MHTKDSVKKQAARLKEFFNQKGLSITHSTCLLAVAKIHGYPDWNTMSAVLKEENKFGLFEENGLDQFYSDVRSECYSWHAAQNILEPTI